ncbi:MAG: ATP-binding protein [Chlamydiae bacterium]|nr:ATP-binding protein [Chlamydiota bacterium]MBI3277901.1 ATP-binding protein [Chlamydiota bacterium]
MNRTLDLSHYKYSLFLLGPRQVGKTYLLKNTLSPDLMINLLSQSEFIRYSKDISLLSKEISALKKEKVQVVIDEIQRLPELLNEVHLVLESSKNVQFILTGSSARKLRRSGVNLLGGRALTLHLHPLTHEELAEAFHLEEVLQYGSLPKIVLEENPRERKRLLKSYAETYLKEEIQQEALTRNIPAFARFLELAAFENGNLLNFNSIAREVGVHSKTIKEYFQILEDTLIGFFLYPYTPSPRKKLVLHPKFYFFDRGIVTALRNELSVSLISGTPPYGYAFEHWIVTEMRRLLEYREREVRLSFLRTSDGAEIDIILEWADGKKWAIEIKASSIPQTSQLRGLKSLMQDHPFDRTLCVSLTPRAYHLDSIEVLPWKTFFEEI